MKIFRKMFFRIIFILAILICYGINSDSNINKQLYNIAFSVGSNSSENSVNSEIDSFNEDQISQNIDDPLLINSKFHITTQLISVFINNVCFSIWQPPKLN